MATSYIQLASLPGGVVQRSTGPAVANASVNVYLYGTTTPVTIYQGSTGPASGTFPQPLTTDAQGRVPGYIAEAVRVTIVATASSLSSTLEGNPSDASHAGVGIAGPAGPTGPTGTQGAQGAGASWQGVYAGGTTYALGQGVFRNNVPYVSNTAGNVGNDPLTDNGTRWGPLYGPFRFAPTPNGTDDTAAIQAVVNSLPSTGGTVWMALGDYKHSGPVTVPANVEILGQGLGTRIHVTSGTAFAWSFTGGATRISHMFIDATPGGSTVTAQTAGGAFDYTSCPGTVVRVDHIDFGHNLYKSFNMTPSTANLGIYWVDYVRWGGVARHYRPIVVGDGTNHLSDVFFAHCSGTASTNADVDTWATVSNADTVHFLVDCEFLRGSKGHVFSSTTNCKMHNVTWDGGIANAAVQITNSWQLEIVSCTISNCSYGIWLIAGNVATKIVANMVQAIGNDGVDVFYSAGNPNLHTKIANNHFDGINQNNTGSGAAVSLAANVSRFQVLGNTTSDALGNVGHCVFGVLLPAGTSDYYIIRENDAPGATVSVSDGGSGTHKFVGCNL